MEYKRFHVSSTEEREVMKDPSKVSCRLFVGNLPTDEMERHDIRDLFIHFGDITGVLLNRGFGFVQFEKEESASEALRQAHTLSFRGKHIDVKPARTHMDKKPPRRNNWEQDRIIGDRDRSPVVTEFIDRGRDISKYPVEKSRNVQHSNYRVANLNSERGGNDVEIIVTSKNQTEYSEFIEMRLKKLGLSVDLLFPNEDVPIGRVLSNISSRGSLYAILIMAQNEEHRSLTLNILHGQPQEHRNMPLEDAINLLARNFDSYLVREKLSRPTEVNLVLNAGQTTAANLTDRHPEGIQVLLNLLSDNRQLTVLQYDKVIGYLTERRELQLKLELGDTGLPSTSLPLPSLSVGSHQQQELQSRILNILNSKASSSPGPKPAVPSAAAPVIRPAMPSPAPTAALQPAAPTAAGAPLLNDPNVQKALNSLIQGDLLRKFSAGSRF